MWNIIASNRILDHKMKQESYLKHRAALRRIKGQVNVTSPAHYQFLIVKPKTKQLAQQHQHQIQTENKDLVRRMMYTKSRPRSGSQRHFEKESLYGDYLKKITEQIDEENKKLVVRLRDASSSMSFRKFEINHRQMEKWKANISRCKYTGNATQRLNETARPFSAR